MFKGATGKRIFYFSSAMLRVITSIALLIAVIVVKFAVKPSIEWLNALLIILTISGIISGLFNLAMCGMPALAFRDKKAVQIVCFIFTLVTGGVLSSLLTGLAVFTKVLPEDIKNEKVFNVRTFKGE
jgi:FtsH-binding integral membrane protein